uniref:BTB domain-containing protein n=1 Tax=Opuntia streptacantha TaxID=393608 RepID=A0A7C9ETD7_OPUST
MEQQRQLQQQQYPESHRYSYSHHMKMSLQTSQPLPPPSHSDNDRSSVELRALDCNLTSLCDHIQSEGFGNGTFSDIVVHAMGSTYHLHRLILSRSSYFRSRILCRHCEFGEFSLLVFLIGYLGLVAFL